MLIFVSSRRQTRLTALDLIPLVCSSGTPHGWLHMDAKEHELVLKTVRDPTVRQLLEFGIGIHHAGLGENDRMICERLFSEGKIQAWLAVIICENQLFRF